MSDQPLGVRGEPSEISIEATVIRADGTREELGVVSHWAKDPAKRSAPRPVDQQEEQGQ